MAIVHSFVVFSCYYTNMSVRPYQFEPLKKCPGHVEEDCGDTGETSNIMNMIWRLSYR